MIEVKNLTKMYGDHVGIKDVSFTVQDGQVYGLLGPNGAGKTTTMNIMTGYLAATSGTVVINGYDIFDYAEEAKRRIGYLPEHPPLYMELTVREYLDFCAGIKGLPKEKRDGYIKSAMENTGTAAMEGRLIKHLSKGYQQRVGFAQAILGEPEVIILDEPTVGLDPKQIIEIRNLIKSLGRMHTVILSSHILSEISAICDRLLIISRGRLVANGTPEELASLIRGSTCLIITTRGSEYEVRAILGKFRDISKYSVSKPTDGVVKVTIETPPNGNINEKLFMEFAKANCPLLSMENRTVSIEDIFLDFTNESGKASKLKEDGDGSGI